MLFRSDLLKTIIQFVVLVLLVASASVFGATPSYEGGTGLIYMRTADILGDGELDLHFRTGVDKFELEETSDSLVNSALGVTYGLTSAWEVGADLPFVSADGDGASGIPYLKVFTKARFTGGRGKGHSFGGNIYSTVLASDSDNEIGSGENGYGVELNLSLYDEYFARMLRGVSAHFALGVEKADRKTLSPAVVYTSEIVNKLSLGLEINPSELYKVTLEAIASNVPEDDDSNILLVPGVSYHLSNQLSLNAGAAIGLPDERSQPRYRVFAGVSYSFFKPGARQEPIVEAVAVTKKPEPAPAPLPYSVETQVHELPPDVVRQPKPKPVAKAKPRPVVKTRPKPVVKAKPKPVAKPKAKPVGKARIEIWNASGSTGLSTKIGNRLRKKGFLITKIGVVNYYRKATSIYFGPGFEKEAGKIAIAIWQEGEVESTYNLHNKADIQIIVGTDMKQVWKIWNTR